MECVEQILDAVPVSIEQIGGFLAPVSKNFGREIGWPIDVCLGKVENARWEDNCHFDDLFGIIEIDKDWNGEALKIDDRAFLELQIRVSFTDLRVSALKSFDCGLLIGLPNRPIISVPKKPHQQPATLLSVVNRSSHQAISEIRHAQKRFIKWLFISSSRLACH